MSEVLKIVLSLSLSGTLLFFILRALKPLYKNKLSKRWQYYIWLIVIVRMLIPFTPETTLVGSVFQYLENINVGTIQSAPPTNDVQSDFGVGDNYTTPNTEPQAPKSTIDTAPSLSIQTIITKLYENLWILWAAIAFALLIRKITMYQSFVRFVKAGRTEVADIEILNMLADTGEMIGVKRPVELFINPLISSPMLLGFFRPYIILPSIELDKPELAYIIQHELTHYKRLDMFYKWFTQFTVCLHWFNPFAYLLAKEINKCCELSCDEAIIRTMDNDEKKAYGDTLLNSLKSMGNYNDKLAAVTLTEDGEQLMERLDAIMKFKKKSKVMVAVTLALTTMLCFGANAVGAYAAPTVNNDNVIDTLLTSSKVIREGGVYYILCDGADESDKPISGVTEGSVKFVLVRKDGYTSIGGFNDIETLVNEVEEQCKYLLKKQSITQDEAMLIVEIATKIQSGNDSDFIDRKADISQDKEYEKWGLEKRNGAYYYKNEPVRIFMDLRADNSFANFSYNKNGSIDLRLVRNSSDSIVKAEHMTKAEADEILSDLEENPSIKEDIQRLTLKEVPDAIQSAVNSCDDKTWYVIDGDGRQYIYYNNLPHNYAYEYESRQNSLKIVDIGKSTGNYVLLSIPINSNLAINYNSKLVTYANVSVSPSSTTPNDFFGAGWNEEWDDFDKAFSNEKANSVPNTSNVKLINSKQWNVNEIKEIDATYITDDVRLLTSPTKEIILKEYLSEDAPNYYAQTSIVGSSLSIKRGERPAPSSTGYISYIEIYVPVSYNGNVKLETESGGINVTDYKGKVDCSTKTGLITVSDSTLSGTLISDSGIIELSLDNILGNVKAHSKTGDVITNISTSASFSIKATTNTGEVINDFSDLLTSSNKAVSGEWGSKPANKVTLSSDSGNIEINLK